MIGEKSHLPSESILKLFLTICSHIKKRTGCNGFNQKPKNVFCLRNLNLQNKPIPKGIPNKLTTEVKEELFVFIK